MVKTIYIRRCHCWEQYACEIHPADHCCSCFTCRNGFCCNCVDLRVSILLTGLWQSLVGGGLGTMFAVLYSTYLFTNDDVDNPALFITLFIYLLVYWWLYFVTGVIGMVVAVDQQGLLTYEPRTLGLAKVYFVMCVATVLAHLNLLAINEDIWSTNLTKGSVMISFLPLLWDSYILFLAWSLLVKLREQKQGLFRGKPIMRDQAKPEHVVDMHDACHLELQRPPLQVIRPLRHLPPVYETDQSTQGLDRPSVSASEASSQPNVRDSSVSSAASQAVRRPSIFERAAAALVGAAASNNADAVPRGPPSVVGPSQDGTNKPLHAIDEDGELANMHTNLSAPSRFEIKAYKPSAVHLAGTLPLPPAAQSPRKGLVAHLHLNRSTHHGPRTPANSLLQPAVQPAAPAVHLRQMPSLQRNASLQRKVAFARQIGMQRASTLPRNIQYSLTGAPSAEDAVHLPRPAVSASVSRLGGGGSVLVEIEPAPSAGGSGHPAMQTPVAAASQAASDIQLRQPLHGSAFHAQSPHSGPAISPIHTSPGTSGLRPLRWGQPEAQQRHLLPQQNSAHQHASTLDALTVVRRSQSATMSAMQAATQGQPFGSSGATQSGIGTAPAQTPAAVQTPKPVFQPTQRSRYLSVPAASASGALFTSMAAGPAAEEAARMSAEQRLSAELAGRPSGDGSGQGLSGYAGGGSGYGPIHTPFGHPAIQGSRSGNAAPHVKRRLGSAPMMAGSVDNLRALGADADDEGTAGRAGAGDAPLLNLPSRTASTTGANVSRMPRWPPQQQVPLPPLPAHRVAAASTTGVVSQAPSVAQYSIGAGTTPKVAHGGGGAPSALRFFWPAPATAPSGVAVDVAPEDAPPAAAAGGFVRRDRWVQQWLRDSFNDKGPKSPQEAL